MLEFFQYYFFSHNHEFNYVMLTEVVQKDFLAPFDHSLIAQSDVHSGNLGICIVVFYFLDNALYLASTLTQHFATPFQVA